MLGLRWDGEDVESPWPWVVMRCCVHYSLLRDYLTQWSLTVSVDQESGCGWVSGSVSPQDLLRQHSLTHTFSGLQDSLTEATPATALCVSPWASLMSAGFTLVGL